MLNYNEIRERVYIVLDGDPYEVVDSSIKKKNRQKPTNQTKLKNLISGAVRQVAFHQSDVVEEADIEKKKVTYSFHKFNRQTNQDEFWFYEDGDKSKRISLSADLIGDKHQFMKEHNDVEALYFKDQIIGISLPIKVNLEVVEAPPAVKGDTATGATKIVKTETGFEVSTPLFISTGDVIVVKTETGEYVERAK